MEVITGEARLVKGLFKCRSLIKKLLFRVKMDFFKNSEKLQTV